MDVPLPRRAAMVLAVVLLLASSSMVHVRAAGREGSSCPPTSSLFRNNAVLLAAEHRGNGSPISSSSIVASSSRSSSFEHHDAISLSRSKFSRWKQRCRHRRLTQRVPVHKAQVESKGRQGTCLRIVVSGGPCNDEDSIADLFGADRHSSSGHHPTPFNHNMVGMTNPCLHIGVKDRTLITIPASSMSAPSGAPVRNEGGGGCDVGACWWPGTACFSGEEGDEGQEEGDAYSGWKVLRLRRRVGQSHVCYQAVRDAALKWEFDAGDVGIACVHSSANRSRHRRRNRTPKAAAFSNDDDSGYSIAPGFSRVDASSIDPPESRRRGVTASDEEFHDAFQPSPSERVQQIWSGPGSRRLVTYTAQPSIGPVRVVAMNPVGVVYDLVDQRGWDGTTTYTSTAYATLRGHWLTGEERVTVALRDNGSVDVEILSYSRPSPNSWPGRVLWPLLGGMQRRFFEQQLNALERVASQSSPTVPSGFIRATD